jgi:transposase InsO family protein
MFGDIGNFIPGTNDVNLYCQRLEQFMLINKIKDDQKVSLFYVLVGEEALKEIRKSMAPDDPLTKTFAELVAELKKLYKEDINIIIARYKFHQLKQNGGTITEFILSLKEAARNCDFKECCRSDALRDRLVAGIDDNELRNRLLAEKELKFEKACELAHAYESSKKAGGELMVASSSYVNFVKDHKQGQCFRCGRNHNCHTCPAKDWICLKCKNKGHIARLCKNGYSYKKNNQQVSSNYQNYSKNSTKSNKFKNNNRNQVNLVEEVSNMAIKGISAKEEVIQSQELIALSSLSCGNIQEEIPASSSNQVSQVSHVQPELVKLKVENITMEFEVDTGSPVTVVSFADYEKYFKNLKIYKTISKFLTVTGSKIKEVGQIEVKVRKDDESEVYELNMVIINTDKQLYPLLGRNWLNVLFPWWRNFVSGLQIGKFFVHNSSGNENFLVELKRKYPFAFSEDSSLAVKDFVADIVLEKDACPIFHKPYSVPYKLREKVENELSKMVNNGILIPVKNSRFASPIVVLEKKDGSLRICLDGKATINKCISMEHYPYPKFEDIFTKMANCKYFCVIDLSQAYLQVKVSENSQEILTINTHKGLFKFTRLIFGLKSAPAIFQSLIDLLITGCSRTVGYLDDILIGGETVMECQENLFKILGILNERNIRVNLSKCQFFKTSVVFVGHIFCESGIKPSEEKFRAIIDAPPPNDIQQLRAYLGLLNFYSRFIPNLSSELSELYKLLQKNVKFVWSESCQRTFEKSKQLLLDNNVLEPFDMNKPIVLSTDASPYGVSAILSHLVKGIEKPVLFASSTLSIAEKGYSQLHKEALAIMFGIKRFHDFIYGQKFKLVTDNRALKEIFHPDKGISAVAASRLQRWALQLAIHNYTIEHRPGKYMSHVDALSRLPLPEPTNIEYYGIHKLTSTIESNEMSKFLNAEMIEKAISTDKILSQIRTYIKDGWPKNISPEIKYFYNIRKNLDYENGNLFYNDRLIIPMSMRHKILELLHSNHDGIVRMKMLSRTQVWWPKLDSDIENVVKQCSACQQVVNKPKPKITSHWKPCTKPFERIHIDFFYYENKTFLIIVDSYSKFIDVKLVTRPDAIGVIEKLEEVFSYFGLPDEIVSDSGPPFLKGFFEIFCQNNGIIVLKSPPHSPQSNGPAERNVQTVKTALAKYLLDAKLKPLPIHRKLSRFLLNYRNTPSPVTDLSPAGMIFVYKPRTLTNSINPRNPSLSVKHKIEIPNINPGYKFKKGDKVMYKNHFRNAVRWIPARIVDVLSNFRYLINIANNARVVSEHQIRFSLLHDSAHPPSINTKPNWNVAEQNNTETQNFEKTTSSPIRTSDPSTLRRSNRDRQPPNYYQA